jgi:putative spermidine/putrescine transport system ATP-binding protein
MASITLRDLTMRFGNVTAVDRLNLTLKEGELIAFLGPSGCGKTTTLRMIAGFETPSDGEIRFGDNPVQNLMPDKRNIGMVFQNYALFPHMTVEQNVAFGLEMRGLTKPEIEKRVAEILAKTQIGQLGKRYPRQLSGGQQQRTALARALVINPEVLLLDEPLANLDAKLREEMRFYIRHLQREFGITTIYVTHDQAEAMVLADRIAVIMNGILQQLDVPEEIYRRPASRQVAEFIGLTNFLRGKVVGRTEAEVEVETAVGVVRSAGAASLTTGSEVLVSVRPESLHFTDAEGPNTVGGVVLEKSYLGNLVDYQVEVSPSMKLRVQADPAQKYVSGDKVRLKFAPGDAWAMPGEGR